MAKEKLPGFVPLSEVQEYTDNIYIGGLGLPVGFEPDNLELNVRGLSRDAKFAGLNKVTIVGYRGDTTEYSYGAGSIGADGSSTLSIAHTQSRASLGKAEAITGEKKLPPEYRWGSAVLRINNAEIDERIKADGDKWARSMIDPRARAKYTNDALQSAMVNAARESILPNPPVDFIKYAAAVAFIEWWDKFWGISPTNRGALAVIAAGWAPVEVGRHLLYKTLHRKEEIPPRKWSTTLEIPFDRLAIATFLAKTTKFIRTQKQ